MRNQFICYGVWMCVLSSLICWRIPFFGTLCVLTSVERERERATSFLRTVRLRHFPYVASGLSIGNVFSNRFHIGFQVLIIQFWNFNRWKLTIPTDSSQRCDHRIQCVSCVCLWIIYRSLCRWLCTTMKGYFNGCYESWKYSKCRIPTKILKFLPLEIHQYE